MGGVKNISELLPDEPIPPPFDEEIIFNNAVREYTLFGVVLMVLVVASHVLLSRYRRSAHHPHDGPPSRLRQSPALLLLTPTADDEQTVDTIAMWLCTFSLSVSLGAVLLLPLSIVSNEVLAIYRDSHYVRWINRSLIQGLWNMIFLFSNLSLFVGLPFAYLFTEAEGFPGTKKGVRGRMLETVVVLMLLVVLVMGVAFIVALLLGYCHQHTLLQTIDVWGSFYLPFLYSLISCLGVLFLLLCTPVGLGRLFSALKGLIRGGGAELPSSTSVEGGGGALRSGGGGGMEELFTVTLEEQALARKLQVYGHHHVAHAQPEDEYHQQWPIDSPTSSSSPPMARRTRSSSLVLLQSSSSHYDTAVADEEGSSYHRLWQRQVLAPQEERQQSTGGGTGVASDRMYHQKEGVLATAAATTTTVQFMRPHMLPRSLRMSLPAAPTTTAAASGKSVRRKNNSSEEGGGRGSQGGVVEKREGGEEERRLYRVEEGATTLHWTDLHRRWQVVYARKRHLESMSQQGLLRRCLVYPLGVLVLVLVTGVVVVLVVFNALQLVSGFKTLPLVTTTAAAAGGCCTTDETGIMLGKRAVLVWVLGPLGAVVEVLLVLYLVAASLVGCYSLTPMKKMKPVRGDTPMVHLIGNCVLLLIMASALPLLATTLGLTNFDLLGDYGRVAWLGNFWIVLAYNVLFASAAVWCLVHQFTAAVRGEIYARLWVLGRALGKKFRSHDGAEGGIGSSATTSSLATVAHSALQRALLTTTQQGVTKRE